MNLIINSYSNWYDDITFVHGMCINKQWMKKLSLPVIYKFGCDHTAAGDRIQSDAIEETKKGTK